MADCIFCKIASGEIPAEIVYKDKGVIGFKDLHPVSPTHVLFIPKKHYSTLNDIPSGEFGLIGDLTQAITEVAKKEGISQDGYRVVANVNKDAGQEIFHLHFHLMGGRRMGKMG